MSYLDDPNIKNLINNAYLAYDKNYKQDFIDNLEKENLFACRSITEFLVDSIKRKIGFYAAFKSVPESDVRLKLLIKSLPFMQKLDALITDLYIEVHDD